MLQQFQWLIVFTTLIISVYATPDLLIEQDDRKFFRVAEFGFLQGGELSLSLKQLSWENKTEEGRAAFFIRKSWIPNYPFDPDAEVQEDTQFEYQECFLDYSFIKDEVKDGISTIAPIPESLDGSHWDQNFTVASGEEGLWQVFFVSCKKSAISFEMSISEINPGGNYLPVGDFPLSKVYATSAMVYFLATVYWSTLLVNKKNTRVFRVHWLMSVLMLVTMVNKGLQSAKYHYMSIGVLSEGWKISFYVFTGIKGVLSLLLIILLASGWMFIKPFLSARDKKVVSIIIPIQVLGNIASALSTELAIGSVDWTFWYTLLPLMDISGCGIILWTILQTRKNLVPGAAADGKEADVLHKYRMWTSFYVVTLIYVYITRIIAQLLSTSLSYEYAHWCGEAINEAATFLFYVFIGYKFRPLTNNPYMQVPDDEDEEEIQTFHQLDSMPLNQITNRRRGSDVE